MQINNVKYKEKFCKINEYKIALRQTRINKTINVF